MDKKPLSDKTIREQLLMNISLNSRSWHPVMKNNWIIKFSLYESNVLLIVTSALTAQTIVRYFADENSACDFLNYILSQDAGQSVLA